MSDEDTPDQSEPRVADRKRPTQKTISQMTGLAIATVSRALADAPDIGTETKRRVREVAQEIGYRPDRAGVRLRTGKTNVISLILSTESEIMNHTAQLIYSIAGGLRNTPYHMIVTPYFQGEDPMVPVRYVVETRSADAVILNQTQPEDPRIAYLMEQGFPFATHGRTDWCEDHAYFDFDNVSFASLAIDALVANNRRNILLVLPPLDQNYAQEILQGARIAGERHGLSLTLLQDSTADDGTLAVTAAVKSHLIRSPQTDGIVCSAPGAAIASVIGIEELNLVLGQDIDIAAKEAIPILKQFRKPIMTVAEDVGRAGTFLARATMQAIAEPDKHPLQALEVPETLT